jgi:hypothetical protein
MPFVVLEQRGFLAHRDNETLRPDFLAAPQNWFEDVVGVPVVKRNVKPGRKRDSSGNYRDKGMKAVPGRPDALRGGPQIDC